jgi:hypothetical protein
MSTSLSPRSSGSSGHPTRQQLDELDALLQRMLALPVNQAGDDVMVEISAPPKAAAPTLPPRFDEAHISSVAEEKSDSDNWVPLSSTWKPSPHTWKPLAQSWQQPRETPAAQETPPKREEPESIPEPAKPVEPPRSVAVESPAPTVPVKTEAKPPAMPAPLPVPRPQTEARPPLAGWQTALVWFNCAFDLLLLPWGLPGRWLRRDGGGRPLLGGLGVLLLLAAVGLGVMEWFGWTWEDVLARIR